MEPKTLKWELNGDASPQIIRIKMKEGSVIRVTGVTCSIPAFKPELKTIEEGKSYELMVTPTAIQTPGLGVIRIETDAASAKHRLHQAFAVVRKMTPAEAAAVKP
jgi:hypothetical protein